jgi:ankyrin repeat protein
LHYAAKYGRTEVVCILLAEGADVNKVNKEKITPLQFAVMKEDVDIVEMLLDKGADPDIVNIFGFTALDYAKVNSANEEIEKILLQAKNNILLLEESQ